MTGPVLDNIPYLRSVDEEGSRKTDGKPNVGPRRLYDTRIKLA
jgi:hypothetical protein